MKITRNQLRRIIRAELVNISEGRHLTEKIGSLKGIVGGGSSSSSSGTSSTSSGADAGSSTGSSATKWVNVGSRHRDIGHSRLTAALGSESATLLKQAVGGKFIVAKKEELESGTGEQADYQQGAKKRGKAKGFKNPVGMLKKIGSSEYVFITDRAS